MPNEGNTPLEKVRAHVRILVELGKLSGKQLDTERFLAQTVVHIARAIEIGHVKILQYRPETADLLLVAGLGWKEGVVGVATLSADFRSPPGRAYQTGEPITISNLSQQSEYTVSDLLVRHGIVSLCNVPILVDGAAWGVAEVDSTTIRDFSEDTTDFLTAAGAMIGAHIKSTRKTDRNARLIEEAVSSTNRDVLLRELQHRVKNNFQLILSSIFIQKRRNQNKEVHRALDHVASRINAISLAHDQLAVADSGQLVKLPNYLRALSLSIRDQVENVEVSVEADEIELAIDRAVPLGLILNEAATNSIKHAFGTKGGSISIRLAGGVGYGEARLTVSDDGGGIVEGSKGGSGLKLIDALAKQLGGTQTRESSPNGTSIAVTFPV